ncbi:MAG: amidohydrolase family protein [Gammaproteobacteria bacterium]|jgi:predicted TIM-barrel fold metal-dependent hydrolase|nr:amidohydrolase family protein [Gammaproteobacteria bacterium]
MLVRRVALLLVAGSLLVPPAAGAVTPLFDAHLHYNADAARLWPPEQVVATLDRNGVARAVVTGTPAGPVEALHRHAPERVVPFLGVYRSEADKARWPLDESLPERVEQALAAGPWRGVGELHIFAPHRHSPVFRRIAESAARRGLPLQIHGDPAVIDALFDAVPGATVIWAHAGAYPYPPLLADYLERYPGLHVDLSMRDERLAPDGTLAPEWAALLTEYSDRFLVGVDTFSVSRWRRFDEVTARIRGWLAQLPPRVAERVAHRNAERLFAGGP